MERIGSFAKAPLFLCDERQFGFGLSQKKFATAALINPNLHRTQRKK
jgi:hypothetical protein